MKKVKIWTDPRQANQVIGYVETGCITINEILIALEAFAPAIKEATDVHNLINDPPAFIANHMGLYDSALAKNISPQKLLGLLEDPRPAKLAEYITQTKSINSQAISHVLNEGLAGFSNGRFEPNNKQIEKHIECYALYATSEKELNVLAEIEAIQRAMLKLRDMCRLSDDVMNKAPFCEWKGMGAGYVIKPHNWKNLVN